NGGQSGSSSSGTASGTVRIAELEPDHLLPGNSTLAFDEVHSLFAPLTKIDAQGKLQMVQAQSVTSSDQKVWTIKIRPGWTFQNGEPVTAQSYVDAWNATAYAPNGWTNNGELNEIQGYSDLNPTSGTPATKQLSGLQVLGSDQFQVTLTQPDSQFPVELSANQFGFAPLPKVAYQDPAAFDVNPIGDGPFEMDGPWQKNVQVAVKAYPGYKGVDQPKVQKIVFKIYSDIHTAYTDLQAGNVDITSVAQDEYPRAQSDFPHSFIAYAAPSMDYLGFPLYDPRFKDVRVRQAFSMAIDREAINRALFAGVYTPATALTPPSETGSPTHVCPACAYNPTKAKQLLAAAGGWHGPLVIWYPSGAGYDQTFQAIGNQLRQNLGITDVSYQSLPFAQFLQTLNNHQATGPVRGHWGALYPSMQNTLEALFTPGGGTVGSTSYTNPQVTSLINQANAASTPAKSQQLYRQAEQVIMKDFPIAPLFFGKYVYVYGKGVSHVTIDVNQIELTQLTATGAR
ncbi:MAG: ABC transporter substrate-binding protein, partial [Candidatus Dormiibacterota bacterium]